MRFGLSSTSPTGGSLLPGGSSIGTTGWRSGGTTGGSGGVTVAVAVGMVATVAVAVGVAVAVSVSVVVTVPITVAVAVARIQAQHRGLGQLPRFLQKLGGHACAVSRRLVLLSIVASDHLTSLASHDRYRSSPCVTGRASNSGTS